MVCFWGHLTICHTPGWHLSMQHLSWLHFSTLEISQLLLTRFWWDFKGSFLGTSTTDSNYQVDICQGKICPINICIYQFRQIVCYLAELFRQIAFPPKNTRFMKFSAFRNASRSCQRNRFNFSYETKNEKCWKVIILLFELS